MLGVGEEQVWVWDPGCLPTLGGERSINESGLMRRSGFHFPLKNTFCSNRFLPVCCSAHYLNGLNFRAATNCYCRLIWLFCAWFVAQSPRWCLQMFSFVHNNLKNVQFKKIRQYSHFMSWNKIFFFIVPLLDLSSRVRSCCCLTLCRVNWRRRSEDWRKTDTVLTLPQVLTIKEKIHQSLEKSDQHQQNHSVQSLYYQ